MTYRENASHRRSDPENVVYLDHAATTPMLPEAIAAMTEELAQVGNPSSLHNQGRRARRIVEESREQIAEAYGARPSEVVFTSGGTEADNLAIKGLFWARRDANGEFRRVLVTSAEHHAVLDSFEGVAANQSTVATQLGEITGQVADAKQDAGFAATAARLRVAASVFGV